MEAESGDDDFTRDSTHAIIDSAAPPLGSRTAPGPKATRSVGASDLRRVLRITPHQLGELTSRLRLDVGDRPNYPRYHRADVHLLTAVLALRELRLPLDDACAAVLDYSDHLVGGQGWILLYPTNDRWIAIAARAIEAVASLLTLTCRASVVDLPSLRHRSDTAWLDLLGAPRHADGGRSIVPHDGLSVTSPSA